jgi:dTDP-4-amino-4,6-dideoxygalactose transaminase
MEYIKEAIKRGNLAGPGPFSKICEQHIRQQTTSQTAYLVPSCTAALEMSALLLDVSPGDEVIMPSFTFVSTANAVVLRGGTPVFVDVDPITFNLDPQLIEAAITPRTKAICVVHYAGVPADMKSIAEVAAQYKLNIIEDAAQAYGSTRDGKPAGSFGRLACFSFHGTKNISAGEAGAIVVNDDLLRTRADILREKGTDRYRFLRGEVGAYKWQDVGSSQVVSELVAAYLAAQLEVAEEIHTRRRTMWNRYAEGLSELCRKGYLRIPDPPKSVKHNAHIFFLTLPDIHSRDRLKQYLLRFGITALSHYEPLHLSPAGIRFGRIVGSMEQTERAGECLLRLPLYNNFHPHQDDVIGCIGDWCRLEAQAFCHYA